MVESTEDRSRRDPRITRELMAGDQGRGKPGWGLRKPRAKTRVRAAAVVMHLPRAKDPTQVFLAEWDEKIQALAAEAAQQAVAERVRLGLWSVKTPS